MHWQGLFVLLARWVLEVGLVGERLMLDVLGWIWQFGECGDLRMRRLALRVGLYVGFHYLFKGWILILCVCW